jgi:hypothetical protein
MLEINDMRADTNLETGETTVSTDRIWPPATIPRLGLLFVVLFRGKLHALIVAPSIEEARAQAEANGKAPGMGWRVLPARVSWVAQ